MFESIFSAAEAQISVENFFICLGVALVLGIIMSITHKLTTKTTPNFLLTLAVLPVLVMSVILLINGNLGTSLAVAGAFSLIRFRSIAGSSKEIISVFWAMAVGLALGMGYITLAATMTLIVAVIMFIYSLISKKTLNREERKLKIQIPENLDYEEVFGDVLNKYTNNYDLAKVKTTNMGSMFELHYMVELKKNIKEKEFMDEIRVRNGNMLVMLERPEFSEVAL